MSNINKRADKITALSVIQMVAGVFVILLFGIIALISSVWSFFTDASSYLSAFIFLISVISGGFIIWNGYRNYKLSSRFRRVSRAMGEDTSVKLSVLEERLDWDQKKLLKALRRQIDRGFWPDSFLDTDKGLFTLGYDPTQLKTDSGNKTLDELLGTANDHIHEMVTASRSIADTDLSTQVETIVQVAKQIYAYIEKNPEKSSLVRQLSNYVLPTTVDLLSKYLDLQNQTVKIENMQEAMDKIKDVMNTIESAFKQQLNSLYSEKSMDVSVEIEVMQNMLG